MPHTPVLSTPRDCMLDRLARLNSSVMWAVSEAARVGMPSLESDLRDIWMEIIRVESSLGGMRYPKRAGQRGSSLRDAPQV